MSTIQNLQSFELIPCYGAGTRLLDPCYLKMLGVQWLKSAFQEACVLRMGGPEFFPPDVKEENNHRTFRRHLEAFNDPFADATKGDDLLPAGTEDYIHIRIQQRNGRKTLTTVQGIADDYDKKKLVKAFKKKFACNGTVIEHPEYGEVIQLQGDQRKNICQFLLEVGIVKEEQLKVHGF
uniref:Eukaryotic translation initiation factor 1B n=1 Tax=Podarcis muralis TaxID=64176 RepID=A0A670JPB5_PODMU